MAYNALALTRGTRGDSSIRDAASTLNAGEDGASVVSRAVHRSRDNTAVDTSAGNAVRLVECRSNLAAASDTLVSVATVSTGGGGTRRGIVAGVGDGIAHTNFTHTWARRAGVDGNVDAAISNELGSNSTALNSGAAIDRLASTAGRIACTTAGSTTWVVIANANAG